MINDFIGPLRDIEDLNVTVVSCPWHKFLVSIGSQLMVLSLLLSLIIIITIIIIIIKIIAIIISSYPCISLYAVLDGGLKVYQAVEFVGNKPKPSGWKIGKMVQRAHKVMETDSSIYIVSRR
jgi:hypothetical protein